MAENYAVVRTDNMYGTDVRAGLVSIEYMGEDGATPTAIENGNVLKVGDLLDGEREIFIGSAVAADDAIEDVVLIATPEVVYNEYLHHNLDDFINEAGMPARGYHLHHGDIFSVTAEALDGTPAVGSTVNFAAGTKLAVDGAGTAVGKIIEEDTTTRYTYYVVKVD